MIRSLVQTILDAALYPNVLVYWQKKSGPDANEYVVYTRSGDTNSAYVDDIPLTKDTDVTVRYYYRKEKAETSAGRTLIEGRETTIVNALEAVEFDVSGPFDAGDIDDTGYYASVFECEYSRVV
jgi:hypothetical protein